MNRRGFLQRIGAAVVGLTLARTLPGIAPTPPALQFHPDAFRMAMEPLNASLDAWQREKLSKQFAPEAV